ncbi:MAG TPA: hypothetical protein VJJ79_01320, partial [Candidatus Nanoarchaeia archaeon]|nr:hypothetical protein [Candidatus Nanoarchaeia archaeon]
LLELEDEAMAFRAYKNAKKHPLFQDGVWPLVFPRWIYEGTEGKYNGRFFFDENIYNAQEEWYRSIAGLKVKSKTRKAIHEAFTWGLQRELFVSQQYKGSGPFIHIYEIPDISATHAVVVRKDGLVIDNGVVKKDFAFPKDLAQVVLELSSEQDL